MALFDTYVYLIENPGSRGAETWTRGKRSRHSALSASKS
jgi:hypothetical protein